ncbi:pilus assembly protein [Altererythrobacter sp. KTW20L]|uniref:TadE/TadG family type IV pilus assembly protein n=1 Tax=Altererythrobacter sp. KTW20L TaxID=2942210 RepID=UPI0020BD4F22|nr:TadE family protein [Altererythrobacter sp. KTW20L]MCL6251485.1 pilus assembly protein [Altererythrobacter sp. KTW20L]
MISRFFHSLRQDQRGVAAVEFALWTTSFFFVIMIAIDFGGYYMQRSKLNTAVGAAAVAAFNDADNVNFTDMPGYVRSLSGDQSATVGLSCNGVAASCTNLNRTCSCLKTDGTYASAACGASCTGTGMTAGSTAGYYFTIDASRPFNAMIIPHSVLDGVAVAQRATVRLQ